MKLVRGSSRLVSLAVPLGLAAAATVAASPAFAHTGVGGVSSFAAGIAHPLGGLDHILAMVAVGLWAGLTGGRALWAYPAAFIAFMVVGGLVGFAGIDLPMVEVGIALSVVVLGACVALRASLPVAVGAALCAVVAIVHGYAHGAEMHAEHGAIGYAAGFVLATALLHGVGIALGIGLSRLPLIAVRATGAAVAIAGVALLVG